MKKHLSGKVGASVLFLSLAGMLFPQVASAATSTSASEVASLQSQYLQDGMSTQDASYYAQLQSEINNMNREHKHIPSLKGVKALDPNWVQTHQAEFRKEVLALNPAALKEAINSSLNLIKNGPKDLQALMQRDKKLGIKKNTYTVVYPDGSSISETTSTVRVPKKGMKTSTMDYGPWNNSYIFNEYYPNNQQADGQYITTTTVDYSGGVNYSKVEDQLTWNTYSGVTTAVADTGSFTNSGIFEENIYQQSEMPSQYSPAYGTQEYIQGYTGMDWKVTASFSVSAYIFTVTGSANYTWWEYAVDEVDGTGFVYAAVAQYT
ncbi:hypothetical protein [Alicyclobacillus mengziensis]|uniref:Uncharacterized protein n=1 Tax=Alicyclobacillus mengziensis TaxID=2931921 RepID=A0A9X7Z8U3_9BACL|nr:hypothetical protein [Alicyclobacillus mengziensis]QSO48753.1 hypothetical protein JZ786_07275 [Alicyclobacillus mengziensis]